MKPVLRAHKGFTLLEVLVALVVIAIGLASLIKGAGTGASNAAYLRDKTFSQWVGMNVIAEQQLLAADKRPKSATGSEKMGGHSWYWSLKYVDTFDDAIKRLEVKVAADKEGLEQPVSKVVAFMQVSAVKANP